MMPPPYDTSLVDQQTAIRGWGVENWDVPWEIEPVNDLDPEILTITHDSLQPQAAKAARTRKRRKN